jgi:heme-dependent oxidative N-demethylase alpha subunit-like protein
MKYLPFLNGKYSTAPGLMPMDKSVASDDKVIFQFDEHYQHYIANKNKCRKENIHKYYCEKDSFAETMVTINHYIANRLLKEHPAIFSLTEDDRNYVFSNHKLNGQLRWKKNWINVEGNHYLSLFDALCCQAQDDFAICQFEGEKDWMSAIHLCAPNHWAAGDKIGRTFDVVHAPVPGMEKTLQNYTKMLQSVIHKGPFTRFAWGISTDKRLNHHPVPPSNSSLKDWHGRKVGETNKIFVRTERQNMIGFPDVNAFLFTIRTYFYNINALSYEEKNALFDAVASMSPASLEYKGLTGKVELIKRILLP